MRALKIGKAKVDGDTWYARVWDGLLNCTCGEGNETYLEKNIRRDTWRLFCDNCGDEIDDDDTCLTTLIEKWNAVDAGKEVYQPDFYQEN